MPDGIRLALQITPNAKKTEVIGPFGEVLKIRLHAQPIEGKANAALILCIADFLNVSRSAVLITHGHTGKRKILEVSGHDLTVERVRQACCPSAKE